jgi:hypothetical protein
MRLEAEQGLLVFQPSLRQRRWDLRFGLTRSNRNEHDGGQPRHRKIHRKSPVFSDLDMHKTREL